MFYLEDYVLTQDNFSKGFPKPLKVQGILDYDKRTLASVILLKVKVENFMCLL